MTFNTNCKYLGLSVMEVGKESAFRKKHRCLSGKNKSEWIYECPENCPYFEQIQE